MSHNTGHEEPKAKQSIISFKNSFWLVVIVVGLFVAALNFIQAESGGEEAQTVNKESAEMKGGTIQEENRTQIKPEEHPTPGNPTADTSKMVQ